MTKFWPLQIVPMWAMSAVIFLSLNSCNSTGTINSGEVRTSLPIEFVGCGEVECADSISFYSQDSIVQFSYFLKGDVVSRLILIVRDLDFFMMDTLSGADFELADQRVVSGFKKHIKIKIYEKRYPPIDGNISIAINDEFGLIGLRTDWRSHSFLKKWDSITTEINYDGIFDITPLDSLDFEDVESFSLP